MKRTVSIRVALLATIISIGLSDVAAPRDRDSNPALGGDPVDRIVRFLRKLPHSMLPRVFDDPAPTKP